MKLLLTSAVFLTNCVVAQPHPGTSNYNEETCEIDWIVELQLRFMFGTNIDIDNLLTVDTFTRNYELLELVYLAYHDNFRRLLRDSHGNLRGNWEPRLDYYYQRLRLATEEVTIAASTGHQRCDQYMAHVPTRSISLSVPCGSLIGCSCGGPNKLYQQDCTETMYLHRHGSCVTYTVRVPENSEEIGAARTLITLTDKFLLHGFITRLYKARNSHRPSESVEILKMRLRQFFRLTHVVRIYRRVRIQTEFHQYGLDVGMMDVDVNRMISDDEYFAETMRRPEMLFDDDADELKIILQNLIAQKSSGSDSSSQHSHDSMETLNNPERMVGRPDMWIGDEVETLSQDHMQDSSRRRQINHILKTLGNSENTALHRFLARTDDCCSKIQGPSRQRDLEISPFERALYGFDNSDSWHCRPLTENELEDSHNGTTRSSRRSKRSVPAIEKRAQTKKLDNVVRQRVMDFALVSIMDQTEANYLNKSLEWSKDFKYLYDQYLNDDWTNILCDNSSLGFDNFLYSRLHQHSDLFECINSNVMKDKWCSVARRIFKDTDSKDKNLWLNELPRPKQFLKDRVRIYKILIDIPEIGLKPKSVIHSENYKANDFYLNNDVIDLAYIILTFAQTYS